MSDDKQPNETQQAIAVTQSGQLAPSTFGEMMEFCKLLAHSGMVPDCYSKKPGAVFLALQMGAEVGLPPTKALANIAVVNGRASMWGDAMLALVRSHPLCQDIEEWKSDDGTVAYCRATRRGSSPVEVSFSVDDAKRAQLWGKKGPWTQYPKRMLQMRARGFALRDAFPDVLGGMITREEARDIIDMGAAEYIEASAPIEGKHSAREPKKPRAKRAKPSEPAPAPEPEVEALPELGDEAIDILAQLSAATNAEQVGDVITAIGLATLSERERKEISMALSAKDAELTQE